MALAVRGSAGWLTVVRGAGFALAALLLVTGLALGDREALALSALTGAAAVLVVRGRRRIALLGALALGVLALNSAAWMLPAAWENVRSGEDLLGTLLPSALAILSVGLLASLAGLASGRAASAGPKAVALGGAGALVAAALFAVTATGDARGPRRGDVEIRSEDARFSTGRIEVPAGRVTVHFENRDLFWHTFTVSELDVDLRVPVRAERRVSFEASAGTYEFVCAIPGHPQIGMRGLLVVGAP